MLYDLLVLKPVDIDTCPILRLVYITHYVLITFHVRPLCISLGHGVGQSLDLDLNGSLQSVPANPHEVRGCLVSDLVKPCAMAIHGFFGCDPKPASSRVASFLRCPVTLYLGPDSEVWRVLPQALAQSSFVVEQKGQQRWISKPMGVHPRLKALFWT